MIVNGKSNAPTYAGAATDIYNQSLKNTTGVKRQLVELYKSTLDKIEVEIQRLKNKGAVWSATRLEAIQKETLDKMRTLAASEKRIVTSGYIRNMELSYYGTGYEYTKYVNAVQPVYYELGYSQLPREYIVSTLNQKVGGLTFTERVTSDIYTLQKEVRQSIGMAVIKGDSAATTALNIQRGIDGIGSAMNKAVNSSLRIATTEMLTAYSLGHEMAANQAEAAGVDLAPTWNATLDGKTREEHGNADGKQFILDGNGDWMITVGGVVFSSPRVALYSVGGDIAKQSIYCRCRRNSNPFGFQPVSRVARKEDGSWDTVSGDMNYSQWAKTTEGRKEINKTIADRSLRAKELRIMRAAKKDNRTFTKDEKSTLADIRKQIKGRIIPNVGTRTNIA